MKKLTIRDIAKAAGVSPATVSLVLNGKGEISDQTRARVQKSVAALNYVHRGAKVSVEVNTNTLRFLKISKHGHTVNRDHSVFISDYIDGMSAEATRRNYTLEVLSFEEQPISAVAESLRGAPISGAIALGTELCADDVRLIQSVGVPTVFIDTFYDLIDANCVDMNNEDAVFKVLSRLHAHGFERIGFVGSHVETTNFKLRREAYFKNMQRLGLSVIDEDVLAIESTHEGAYEDTKALLQNGLQLAPSYFCTNDIIAFGFMKALKELGVRIPEDVSIIGFDNLPQSATTEPALTTIDVSKRKIGYLSIAILDDLISATDRQPAIKVLVSADLVGRASDAVNIPNNSTSKLLRRQKT